VAQLLQKLHFTVSVRELVPDDSIKIQNLLIRLAREVQIVVTTGGTGIAASVFTGLAVARCNNVWSAVAPYIVYQCAGALIDICDCQSDGCLACRPILSRQVADEILGAGGRGCRGLRAHELRVMRVIRTAAEGPESHAF